MHGAVCLRGTRIPVSVVLDNLAAGESPQRILEQYPTLKPEHIAAAIAYAADLARERVVRVPFIARRMSCASNWPRTRLVQQANRQLWQILWQIIGFERSPEQI
jgi:uncharacterized protein (DUF433 family)